MFNLKISFFFPAITLTTEFLGSNFLLPTFAVGSKHDFQMANLPLATVNFEPWLGLKMCINISATGAWQDLENSDALKVGFI